VLVETVPATFGFPVPPDGYLPGVAALARDAGALYIADEVQTGLGRTGPLWGVEHFGVEPDVLVTGKGLSGGLYPITATVLSERAGAWLETAGWDHVSTFGGAEPGCRVARAVLDITTSPSTRTRVDALTGTFAAGLADLAARHSGWLVEVRQTGLVIGVRFAHEQGGLLMAKACADAGLWAVYANFDQSVLQVKPGLLMDDATAAEALERLDLAMGVASGWVS
jgi:acetylornithine/succinyldiaminopimelate/putrescine aminotransferase